MQRIESSHFVKNILFKWKSAVPLRMFAEIKNISFSSVYKDEGVW
jgi:hypothetical protein